jgi:CHAD domain-containing protein
MKTKKFFERWKRRYLRLLHKQWMVLRQSRREGKPEQVHELRVTLRRLRLLVRLGEPFFDKSVAEEYRRWSRVISTLTSRLRDFDVTLDWLKGQKDTADIIELLQTRRDRLWRIQKAGLTPPTGNVRSRLSRIKSGSRKAARLRRRFLKRFDRLRGETFDGIPHFFGLNLEDRHAFRRALRRLRYLRELALSRGKRAGDEFLKNLIRPQVAMGESQNLVMAGQIINALKRTPTSLRLVKILGRQRELWKAEIRRGLKGLSELKPENTSKSRAPGTGDRKARG